MEAGLLFSAPEALHPDALALPAAYRLQLKAPTFESRRSARSLLAQLDPETRGDVLVAHLGRRSSAPWPLALEEVLLGLESEATLERSLREEGEAARAVLVALEARGGEVLVDEYLDLCKEPGRWTGTRIPRRGVAFRLSSRALVFASADGRVVLPDEVAERVGAERRRALQQKRARVLRSVERRDDEPLRGTLATALAPRALAAWLGTGAQGSAPPRRAVASAARRAGRPFDEIALLDALVRATPMRGHSLGSFGRALRSTWERGRVWDELLASPRVARGEAGSTPTLVLRAIAIDALVSLPRGRFVPRRDVLRTLESDVRFEGVRGAFERGRARLDLGWVDTLELGVDRLLDVSLPALGLLDVTDDGSLRASRWAFDGGQSNQASNEASEGAGVTPPRWETTTRARFDASTSLSLLPHALGVADGVADEDALVLTFDPISIALAARERWLHALAQAGHPDPDEIGARCPPPRGRAVAHRASWLVSVPEATLADELRGSAELSRWLVSPHPEGPFLVFVEGTPRARILTALARAGVALDAPPPAPPRPSAPVGGRPRTHTRRRLTSKLS